VTEESSEFEQTSIARCGSISRDTAQLAPQAPVISGTLRGSTGAPLSGAQVGIVRKAPAAVKATGLTPTAGLAASTVTGPTGVFQVPAKLTGDHLLCVQAMDYVHLDPCLWGTPQALTLKAEQGKGLGTITLERGVELTVIVEDPGGVLGNAQTVSNNPSLIVGYQGPSGIFTPMRLQAVSSNGRGNTLQYAMAIPPNVEVKVVLITHTVRVIDEQNVAMRAGGGSPAAVRAMAGQTRRTLRYRVSRL